jgi:hypothetical protein
VTQTQGPPGVIAERSAWDHAASIDTRSNHFYRPDSCQVVARTSTIAIGVDAGQLAAAAEVVHTRAIRASHGEAMVASADGGYTLSPLLDEMSQETARLPARVRSTAVRLAEGLCRDDQPPRTRAGISGI